MSDLPSSRQAYVRPTSGSALDARAADYGIKRRGRNDEELRRVVRESLTGPSRRQVFPSIDDGEDLLIMRHEKPWLALVLPLARWIDKREELGFILHDKVNGETPLVVVNDWRTNFFSGSWEHRIQYSTYEDLIEDGWRVYRQEWDDVRRLPIPKGKRSDEPSKPSE